MLNQKTNQIAKDKLLQIVKDNCIRNKPIMVGNVKRSHKMYGPPLPEIKKITIYKEWPKIKEADIIEIPKSLYQYMKNVVLWVDFHYVNGVAVFHSILRKVDYRTELFPLSRSKNSIVYELTTSDVLK